MRRSSSFLGTSSPYSMEYFSWHQSQVSQSSNGPPHCGQRRLRTTSISALRTAMSSATGSRSSRFSASLPSLSVYSRWQRSHWSLEMYASLLRSGALTQLIRTSFFLRQCWHSADLSSNIILLFGHRLIALQGEEKPPNRLVEAQTNNRREGNAVAGNLAGRAIPFRKLGNSIVAWFLDSNNATR